MKTTIMKYKDGEGNEQGIVYGDLTELYQFLDEKINNSDKVNEIAEAALTTRRYLAEVITESLHQAKAKLEAQKEVQA